MSVHGRGGAGRKKVKKRTGREGENDQSRAEKRGDGEGQKL